MHRVTEEPMPLGRPEDFAPGSVEWCNALMHRIRVKFAMADLNIEEWLNIQRQLVEHEAWKIFPPEKPAGSLAALVQHATGFSVGDFILRLREISRDPGWNLAIAEEEGDTGSHGGDHTSKEQISNTNLVKQPDVVYWLRRLNKEIKTGKANKVDLTQDQMEERRQARLRLANGELTANAIAIQFGYRKRRVSIRTDDAHKAVETLLEHFDARDLLAALEAALQAPHTLQGESHEQRLPDSAREQSGTGKGAGADREPDPAASNGGSSDPAP